MVTFEMYLNLGFGWVDMQYPVTHDPAMTSGLRRKTACLYRNYRGQSLGETAKTFLGKEIPSDFSVEACSGVGSFRSTKA